MQASIKRDIVFANRLCIPALAIVVSLYGLLVIAPFFLLGIYQQPANMITGGAFDPKGLSPYSYVPGSPGYLLYALTLLTVIVTPIITAVVLPLVGVYLKRCWNAITASQRTIALAAFTGSIALLVFIFTSPVNRLILTWWLD